MQSCVSLCCTEKWISQTYTYIPSFKISFPFRLPRSSEFPEEVLTGLLFYACMHMCVHELSRACHPMDYSPPGSSVHGIFQTRILEWVAMSFSKGFSWPRDWNISCTSCTGRWILYNWATWEALSVTAFGQFLSCWGHLGCAILSVEIIVQSANMAGELGLDLWPLRGKTNKLHIPL